MAEEGVADLALARAAAEKAVVKVEADLEAEKEGVVTAVVARAAAKAETEGLVNRKVFCLPGLWDAACMTYRNGTALQSYQIRSKSRR